MYWSDVGAGVLFSADHDGGAGDGQNLECEVIVTGFPTAVAVDPSAGKIYWAHPNSQSINRTDLSYPPCPQSSPAIEPLVSTPNPEDLLLDLSQGKMYWSDKISNLIQRANLDGTNVENVANGSIEEPRGIALDLKNGKIYWTDHQFGWIQRANLDGTGRQTVISGRSADLMETVAVDTSDETLLEAPFGRVYWEEHDVVSDSSRLWRGDLTAAGELNNVIPITEPRTSENEQFTSGQFRGLVVDRRARKIYWARRGGVGNSKIWRANLDGSDPMAVIQALRQAFRVALDDYCGNDAVDPGEECDDGNFAPGDGCSASCLRECGNGQLDPGEECDDGFADQNVCKDDCTFNVCRDGVPGGPNEECDDGNSTNEDSCKNDCTRNFCGDTVPGGPGEECDDGPADQAVCKNDCKLNVCGDGVPGGPGEDCEDGNADQTDDCVRCREARCGDGAVQAGVEECDPPDSDTCDATCLVEPYCGDGSEQSGVCRGPAPRRSCTADADCDTTSGAGDGDCAVVKSCSQGRIGAPCLDDADCDVAPGSGRCGLQQVCIAGQLFRSCTTDADCSPSGTCYTEPCDDGNGNNNDACVIRDGVCSDARCGDGFVQTDVEACEPANTAKCDGSCQKRTTCRRRLCRLSLLDSGASESRNGRVQVCEPGQPCAQGNECLFTLRLCLGTPDLDPAVSCQPSEVLSIDFVSLDVRETVSTDDPRRWQEELAVSLTDAMERFGATTKKPGRCVEGLRGKIWGSRRCTRSTHSGRKRPRPVSRSGSPRSATRPA